MLFTQRVARIFMHVIGWWISKAIEMVCAVHDLRHERHRFVGSTIV